MSITITGRHMEVSGTLKERILGKLEPMLQEYPQVEHMHVIFNIEKFRQIVEVIIQAKRHVRVEAKVETDDMYKSIDQVVDKIDRQLRRSRDKVVDHKSGRHRAKLADFEQELTPGA